MMRRRQASHDAHENPRSRLGAIREVTYLPNRLRLRMVTVQGNVFEADHVPVDLVDAARPFGDPAKLVWLVHQVFGWRLVSSGHQKPSRSRVARRRRAAP